MWPVEIGDFGACSETWLKCNYLEAEGTNIVYVWLILPLIAASDSYNLLFISEIVSNGGKIENSWFFKTLRFHWHVYDAAYEFAIWVVLFDNKLQASDLHVFVVFATTPTPNSSFFKTCLYFYNRDGDYDFASLWSHDVDIITMMIIIFCCWEPAKLNWETW